jgi:hypothetical protein
MVTLGTVKQACDVPSDDEYSDVAEHDFSTTEGIQAHNTESVELDDDVITRLAGSTHTRNTKIPAEPAGVAVP